MIVTMLRIEYPSLVIAFASFWTILSSCEAAVFGPLCATDDTLAKTFALARASLQITEEVRLQFLETSLCQLYSVVSSSTEHIGSITVSSFFQSAMGEMTSDSSDRKNSCPESCRVKSSFWQVKDGPDAAFPFRAFRRLRVFLTGFEEDTVETRVGSVQLRQNKTTTGLCAS